LYYKKIVSKKKKKRKAGANLHSSHANHELGLRPIGVDDCSRERERDRERERERREREERERERLKVTTFLEILKSQCPGECTTLSRTKLN
jgi:hypothetical protein